MRNRGQTIGAEDMKHIFERVYRADKGRSKNRSYGLGPSIVREIISRRRGKIWAESGDGVTTFFVQLPGI